MVSNQQSSSSSGYIEADASKCSGCQVCMLICSLAHEGKCNTQLSRIQVIQDTYKPWPECIQIKQCRQCLSPTCVAACPAGAAYIDTSHGNVSIIDESKCTGCQSCLEACPFKQAGIIWNDEKQVASKCDLCAHASFWGEAGLQEGKQACVSMCPQKALKFKIRTSIKDSEHG